MNSIKKNIFSDSNDIGSNGQYKRKLSQKYHLRWVSFLICSNIIVLLLARPLETKSLKQKKQPLLKGYTRLILPLKLFVPISENLEVSLYSPSKELLIQKAIIRRHKKNKSEDKFIKNFYIDIPQKRIHSLIPYLESYLLAYFPSSKPKEKKYEISF